jgi:hypothetical protein
VLGHLTREKRDGALAAAFAEVAVGQAGPLAGADQHAAPRIGQRKGGPAVAAVGGAQEREERVVLREAGEGQGAGGRGAGRGE